MQVAKLQEHRTWDRLLARHQGRITAASIGSGHAISQHFWYIWEDVFYSYSMTRLHTLTHIHLFVVQFITSYQHWKVPTETKKYTDNTRPERSVPYCFCLQRDAKRYILKCPRGPSMQYGCFRVYKNNDAIWLMCRVSMTNKNLSKKPPIKLNNNIFGISRLSSNC